MNNRNEQIEVIFNNFHAIKRAYADDSRFSNRRFGVTMAQASVLMLLMRDGRKTMSDVATAMGVSKSAVTQLLGSLIEQGYVDRSQDADDKRIVYVQISRHGHRHFNKVRRGGVARMMELFDLLDDNELRQIEAITTKLAQKAKEIR